MTPLIITSILTVLLLAIIIWQQFASKRSQTYFKMGSALVFILLLWLSEDKGKIYYSVLLSVFMVYIIYKEYISLKGTTK